jgi:sugar phosphate isomerase/epimerase
MYYAGIADEAGADLATQIRATKELGWDHIEMRNIDGTNITAVDDATFDRALAELTDAGIKIVSFGAELANWARPISTDFQVDKDELARAIPRMQKAGTKFIRCMSYPNDKENPLPKQEWRAEVLRRLKELTKMAEDGGVVLIHENCNGYGGESPQQSMELVEEIDSPSFKIVLDTGNPGSHADAGNAWDWYQGMKPAIVHVHIKEYRFEDGKTVMCMPGDGNDSGLPEVLKDLIASGYDGCLSIEPHIKAVVHLGKSAEEDPEAAYKVWIEHGKTLMALMDKLKASA